MSARSDRLVDIGALRTELGRIAGEHRGAATLRPLIVAHLKALLGTVRTEAEALLLRDGQGTRCSERLSLAEDDIIRALHDLAHGTLYPPKEGTAGETISVIAVGGYGRGTLAPGSDIDLLFLLPDRQSERVRNITEFILYTLWDVRQKVGHATRSIEECIRLRCV